jgi:hypothetical protein
MTGDEAPEGGIHLGLRFGPIVAPAAAPAEQPVLDIGFRLIVVGDFGGRGDGVPVEADGADIAALMRRLDATVSFDVPNRLADAPPALGVRLPLASLRDLDPATLADRIPEIARARTAALVAGPGGTATAPPVAASASTPAGDDFDRLLGLVDLPARAPEATAGAALSAFIAAGAKPAATPSAPIASSPVIEAQLRAVASHPRWLAVEAAWRSLRLILGAAGSRPSTRVFVCDLAADADLADVLGAEAFAAALPSGDDLGAVVFLAAFGPSPRDLDHLDLVAATADRHGLPAIVTLSADFFGRPPEVVAAMDNPATLLEAPALAAWRGLTARDEAGWLFPTWNDVVLRPAAGPAPVLWGGAGAALASRVLASLADSGFPTEVIGAEACLRGLDLVETTGPDHRPVALPVRAAVGVDVARLLGSEGIGCLVARPDRDRAWFLRAPAAAAIDLGCELDPPALTAFADLPFRFVSTLIEARLQAAVATVEGAAAAQAAAAIAAALRDLVDASGPGGDVAVVPVGEADGERRFEVTVTLGAAVMGGFAFSLELAA